MALPGWRWPFSQRIGPLCVNCFRRPQVLPLSKIQRPFTPGVLQVALLGTIGFRVHQRVEFLTSDSHQNPAKPGAVCQESLVKHRNWKLLKIGRMLGRFAMKITA